MTIEISRRTRLAVALAALLGGAVAGCSTADRLLQATNPAAIPESQLNNATLVGVLLNSSIGELQQAYADPFIWRGSMLTDEQVTGINWEQTARLNQRIVHYDDGEADFMYRNLQRFRAVADSVAGRFRTLLTTPASDPRMAEALAYAGYGYILLGEAMCQSNFSYGGQLGTTVYTSDQITALAIPKLQEALQIAVAARNDTIANLARVGLARASLQLGKMADVKTYAAQVAASFSYWVYYSQNSAREENVMYDRTHGANKALGVSPWFLYGPFGTKGQTNQTDPRIQYTPDWAYGHNALTKLYTPWAPWSYSTYNGATQAAGGKPGDFTYGTNIRLASGLEAQHDYAEADGPTAATLSFVNARRAYGNEAPLPAGTSGSDLMAALRQERGRDLYLGGYRLGDLRRWKAQGVGDFFPTGPHVNATWGNYGTATCFPIPLEEYNANPGLAKPTG